MRATLEVIRYTVFWRMKGLLNPKSSEKNDHFCVHGSRRVPRPYGIFHPV